MKRKAIFLLALGLSVSGSLVAFDFGSSKEESVVTAAHNKPTDAMMDSLAVAKAKAKELDSLLKSKAPMVHQQLTQVAAELKNTLIPHLKHGTFDAEAWINSGSEGEALIAALYYVANPEDITPKAQQGMAQWKAKGSEVLKQQLATLGAK